jgi:hypothetical protein
MSEDQNGKAGPGLRPFRLFRYRKQTTKIWDTLWKKNQTAFGGLVCAHPPKAVSHP